MQRGGGARYGNSEADEEKAMDMVSSWRTPFREH
jgi:hypothetical protein